MATPRVTIDQLPIQAAPEDTNEIIIQDAGVTKRLTLAALRAAPSQPLLDHIGDTDDAHDATAISTTASNPNVLGTNVQQQLGQLAVLVDGKISQTVSDGLYVSLSGDTMTGPLILVTDPTGALEAATKQYVDNSISAASEGITQSEADALYVNVGGDTMVGSLIVPATPTSALDAVPKQYVDAQVALQLTQAEADALYLKLVGGTLTGLLTLNPAGATVAQLKGLGPAHTIQAVNSAGTQLGYLSWNDANYARLQAETTVYLTAGAVNALTVASGSVESAVPVFVDGQVRGKNMVAWNTGANSTLLSIYNRATDLGNLGTRMGYIGNTTGSDDLTISADIAGAHIKLFPGSAGGNTLIGANNAEVMRAAGSTILMWKTAANADITGYEFAAGGNMQGTRDTNGANFTLTKMSAADTVGGVYATFRRTSAATQVGSITMASTSTTAYNTGSDETKKENISPVDDELAEWMCYIVQPWMYNWIDSPDVTIMGYVAQRVAQAWPGALDIGLVTPPDPDDPGSGWMMDYSKMIPIVHAAWQSSARKLEALTERVLALEGVKPAR